MKVVYCGPHPSVDLFDGGVLLSEDVQQGQAVEVPDEFGARLLEQDTWKAAGGVVPPVVPVVVLTSIPGAALPDTPASPDAATAPANATQGV